MYVYRDPSARAGYLADQRAQEREAAYWYDDLSAGLGATEQEAAQAWAQAQSMGQDLRNAIKGTPKQVIEQFKERAARGVSLFQLVLLPMPFVSAAELFAREVMPAFA